MNDLTGEQIAWLAGIYEGEGCCTLKGKMSLRLEIVMTDEDIIRRFYDLVGIGSFRGPVQRGTNKPTWFWGVGRQDAVDFLETVMPWLGQRRREKAELAIHRWRYERVQHSDTHCIHGHELTPENTYLTNGGPGIGCLTCRRTATAKYRKKMRKEFGPGWNHQRAGDRSPQLGAG